MAEEQKFTWKEWRKILRLSRRVLRLFWKDEPGTFALYLVMTLLSAAVPFAQSGAVALLINGVTSKLPENRVIWLIALLIGVGVLSGIIQLLITYASRRLWFYFELKFEPWLMQRRAEIDVAVHESPDKQNLFNRVSEAGLWRITQFCDRHFDIIGSLFALGVASVALALQSPWIFLIILLGTLPDLYIEFRYGSEIWSIWGAKAEPRRRYFYLQNYFRLLPDLIEVKLNKLADKFRTMAQQILETFFSEQLIVERKKIWRLSASSLLSQLALGIGIGYFAYGAVQGNISPGYLVFLLGAIAAFSNQLSRFFTSLARQSNDAPFTEDVFTLLDTRPVLKQPDPGIRLDPGKTPDIVFDHVTFRYPGTEGPALHDFSLNIPAGTKVALVGVNGAGKTTLVKLLCRFYDPTEGRILVDGHDLREISLESWYEHLGILFQDYTKHRFPVREAIALGRADQPIDEEKVKKAAEQSEAERFIKEWAGQYEQMLGKEFSGGIEPSVGQWQRLALARVFYRDPRVYILDEPTSSIDAEAEAHIFEKLEHLPGDHTVILISHRFSTVRHADLIAVVEDGGATEIGTHEQLLQKNGTYARLFRLQAKGYQ